MLYIALQVFLCSSTVYAVIFEKKFNNLFNHLFVLLTFLSALRYGLGTDYFNYQNYYYKLPSSFGDIMNVMNAPNHLEFGYNLLMFPFVYLNLSFETFIFFVSLIPMGLFYYTINQYSEFKLGSLLIFYSMYYPIYINSAIRQGISLSIIFFAIFKYLKNQHFFKFLLLVLLAGMFHLSSLICLLFIPISFMHSSKFNNRIINVSLVIVSTILFFSRISDLIFYFLEIILNGLFIYEPTNANIYTIVLRIIFLVYLTFLSYTQKNLNSFNRLLFYIYFIGTLMYFSLADIQVLSRLLEFFIISEVILIPNFIANTNDKSTVLIQLLIILSLSSILLAKDIYSFTLQEDYFESGILNYNYNSLFQKDFIYEYKEKHQFDIYN